MQTLKHQIIGLYGHQAYTGLYAAYTDGFGRLIPAYTDTHLSKPNKLLVNHMLGVNFFRFVLILCMGVSFALLCY